MSRRVVGCLGLILCALWLASPTSAGVELKGGKLTVDGRPFFPLGTWSDGRTTAEELRWYGLNTDFRGIGPSAEGPAQLRAHVEAFHRRGLEVVPYFGFGGAGVVPWKTADLEAYLKIAGTPGLLGWYIGDDLGPEHLTGMQATANTVHAGDPEHPVVADYIATLEPGLRTRVRPYLDIMCQYSYPIPDTSLRGYAQFFDEQRAAVGDPMWTWIQAFMWEFTAKELGLGGEGAGPLPEPEQVRLLTYTAISRGVRGLFFFAIQYFRSVPEIAGEIGLLSREIRLAEPYLAAGIATFNRRTSDPGVAASSFTYRGGTAVALVAMGENYHHWVDEGVRENVSLELPAPAGEKPQALLLTFPEPVACVVEPAGRGRVRVTVPRLELAGLVLVSGDPAEIDRVKTEMARELSTVAVLAVGEAAGQVRKVSGAYWALGSGTPGAADLQAAQAEVVRAEVALGAGKKAEAVRAARRAMQLCRRVIDATMRQADARRSLLRAADQVYLKSFYGLPRVADLFRAHLEGPYRFVSDWMIIGTFPLEMKPGTQDDETIIPAGFDRAYPPEQKVDFAGRYAGMAGPVRWQLARADLSGRLDFIRYLSPIDNAVAYASAVVVAPREMETEIGLGSNDGAKLWVNGELLYSRHHGRRAIPNEDLRPVTLQAGENHILLKVENWGRAWELFVSLRDPDRMLEFRAE